MARDAQAEAGGGTLSAGAKGGEAREELQQQMDATLEDAAATMLQAAFRGWSSRQTARDDLYVDVIVDSLVKVQAFRARKEMRAAGERFLSREERL